MFLTQSVCLSVIFCLNIQGLFSWCFIVFQWLFPSKSKTFPDTGRHLHIYHHTAKPYVSAPWARFDTMLGQEASYKSPASFPTLQDLEILRKPKFLDTHDFQKRLNRSLQRALYSPARGLHSSIYISPSKGIYTWQLCKRRFLFNPLSGPWRDLYLTAL